MEMAPKYLPMTVSVAIKVSSFEVDFTTHRYSPAWWNCTSRIYNPPRLIPVPYIMCTECYHSRKHSFMSQTAQKQILQKK